MGIHNNALIGSSGQGGDYTIARSLRFRSSASAYLNRTPASASNQKTWTWSGWVKRGKLKTKQIFWNAGTAGENLGVEFQSDDTIQFYQYSGSFLWRLITTAVYRDPSSWYHIVAVLDTTQGTSSNRAKLYINGVQVTAFSTASYPVQNTDYLVNSTAAHTVSDSPSAELPYDGYLTEVNFIDGQALTPSSFGANNASTGVWQPKKYAGTYGTNGFYLPFSNNSTTTTLGNDFSGNGNNWTTNNISLTAGATYDSMTDVPTLTSATAANFAVVNPLKSFSVGLPTISQANLQISEASNVTRQAVGTVGFNSGKFYWETTVVAIATSGDFLPGIINDTQFSSNTSNTGGYYRSSGQIANLAGTSQTSGSTYTTNDIIGIAVDATAGTVQFYKNNVAQGSTPSFTFTPGTLVYPSFLLDNNLGTKTLAINFGQRPFAYTPPTGFVALNTFNLPTPTIGATASTQANKYFDATTYTGNGSTQSITNSGSMQPDWVWFKRRSVSGNSGLYDSIRGGNKSFCSNETSAETTEAFTIGFNSNGVTIPTGDSQVNANGTTYVAWQWRASNATSVTNNDGSITSFVRVNTTSGFSVVAYTGNGANATVGHGLGVAPSVVICKRRSGIGGWLTGFTALGWNKYVVLNSTEASQNATTEWNGAPTSTVFTLGTDTFANGSGATYVAYCFSEVAGYSKFGSYTGNGSTDGTFVYTGFSPKYVMMKKTSSTGNWIIFDSARGVFNLNDNYLYANSSDSEGTSSSQGMDFLSNGFKNRNTYTDCNDSGATYIYMAFAENPFKYSLAR
jgi:hypothetical protein